MAKIAAEWTRGVLTDRELSMISDFEMTHTIDDITLVHASPFEPDRWHYILSPAEAVVAFEYFRGTLCFHGHSHVPMIFSESPEGPPRQKAAHDFQPFEESRYLINIGSVGQPRDTDPRACYVTFDTETRDICYRRVEYDVALTQEKMAKASLPKMLIERLAVGR